MVFLERDTLGWSAFERDQVSDLKKFTVYTDIEINEMNR